MSGRWKQGLVRLAVAFAVFCSVVAGLAADGANVNAQAGTGDARQAQLMQRLVVAYPDFLVRAEGNDIVWRDGTRMPFDDGRRDKDFATLLDQPDIEDQFYTPYLSGGAGLTPAKDIDPGRVRYEPLFRKMYGDCRASEVEKNLVPVVWLPRHDGRLIMVTSINGVAQKLSTVVAELDQLIDRRPEMLAFLTPPAGTYNCRVIAGSNRASVHAYGAAVDINTKTAHYWQWQKTDAGRPLMWQNSIPLNIVEIFERHGFIWGGKWYHYDTMHFEYRPELFTGNRK